jgi:gamma-glutamyltranspeptidase/glutathione hydrolase
VREGQEREGPAPGEIFRQPESFPGRLTLSTETSAWTREELSRMGYELEYEDITSGPITAIWFDRAHGTMWGGAAYHGEDYGIAW